MTTIPLDTVIASMATPTINTSFLTSAPQAILVIQSLSILTACTTDLSLENNKTTGMIKLLKTPRSFRASLYQLSRGMSESFRTADQTMVGIKIIGNEILGFMASVVGAYAKKATAKMDESWTSMFKALKDTLKKLVGLFSDSTWTTIPSDDATTAGQIAAKQSSANEQLNFEEIANYLPREIKILGQIQQRWTVLENFFGSLESVIFGPIIEHLAKFDAMVKKEGLQNVTHFRNELVSIVLEVVAVLTNVASGANIYNDVSVKYVMPQIDNAVGKMNIPKAEAKKELLGMESKMQETTKEVHDFIVQKLVEMRKATEEKMAAMRDSFQKAINSTF